MMSLALDGAIHYHHGKFPPEKLDYERLLPVLLRATDAIARYDQMLKNMHNSEILLAPLRNQEAVISSRMEGTVSTMDEILKYEADHQNGESGNIENVRSEVIETILYQRSLKLAQQALLDGYPITQSMVKSLHQRLLSFGRGARKSPGEFKTEQNYLADRSRKKFYLCQLALKNYKMDWMTSLTI